VQGMRRRTVLSARDRLARCVHPDGMTKRTLRAGGLAARLALLLSIPAACHHGGSASPSVASPPGGVGASRPTSALAPGASAEATVRGAGPAEALLEAAEGLQLTESQREKVRALKDHLANYERNARAAFRALREDIADQIRAGAIQMAAVRADEDRAAGALTVHVDEGAETMNALHAVLDPSQRAAVVAAVRAAQKPAASPASSPSPFEEPLDRMDPILEGFTGSTFDGWTTVPSPVSPPADALRRRIDREIEHLSAVVPSLRPEQRQRLASTIEER
jgi:Spy/CpxP family protein refolding chaperone